MDNRQKLSRLLTLAYKTASVSGREFDVDEVNDLTDFLNINDVVVQKWISMEEMLPEVDKRYGEYEYSADLLVYDGLRRRVAYYCHTTEMWYDSRYEDDIIEVTHWMPLPEPPKEE